MHGQVFSYSLPSCSFKKKKKINLFVCGRKEEDGGWLCVYLLYLNVYMCIFWERGGG